MDRRSVVKNAGKFPCIVREIVSCQILVVFGLVRVSERACQRDHVRETMSERSCPREHVREIVSERTSQRERVRENESERTSQRACQRPCQRACQRASESYCQRERVREHDRDSMSVSSCQSGLRVKSVSSSVDRICLDIRTSLLIANTS